MIVHRLYSLKVQTLGAGRQWLGQPSAASCTLGITLGNLLKVLALIMHFCACRWKKDQGLSKIIVMFLKLGIPAICFYFF